MGKRRGDPVHGWVILDKPEGMTSTQAVAAVKRALNAAKAGHGGTLDPLASGLLPIALGEATKTVSFAMDGAKRYRFTVRWGIGTDTDDREGETIAESDVRPSRDEIEAVLPAFTGEISQIPPRYSAIKVEGARAYDMAREGEAFELEARPVTIDTLVLVDMPDDDHAVFEAVCGKGTYVRALARDLGKALGGCAHVSSLRRVAVGAFKESDMISLDKVRELRHSAARSGPLEEVVRPVETVLADIPALAVSGAEAARLKQGQAVILRGRDAPILQGTVFVTSQGTPVALVEAMQGALHPRRVFNLAGA